MKALITFFVFSFFVFASASHAGEPEIPTGEFALALSSQAHNRHPEVFVATISEQEDGTYLE